ncbi:hypothetical protein pb186bvf_015961 [Paramecium bursaria]
MSKLKTQKKQVDIRERLRSRVPGCESRRVNYFKMNQGYDNEQEESEYVDEREQQQRIKRIRKFHRQKKKSLNDNLQILLGWKREIQLKDPEIDKSKIIRVKKILKTDLSKYCQGVQGIFINEVFRKEFKQLDLNNVLMNHGIVFIWSEKTKLNEMIDCFEEKGFVYIENLVVVQLNQKQVHSEITKYKDIPYDNQSIMDNINVLQEKVNLNQIVQKKPYQIFNRSKQVLVMFRRFDEQKTPLELRHQRTSDVVFDLCDQPFSEKTKEYLYKLIETLLPLSKFLEIYADPERPRQGWYSIYE